MRFLHPPSQKAILLSELPKEPTPLPREDTSLLEAVHDRGRLRVGYIDASFPYNLVNSDGDLVGFDIEMAHALAEELGVALELVSIPRHQLYDALERGLCDLVMSGTMLTTLRASRIVFSPPYLDETLAFVVPDYRRADFADAGWIRKTPGLRVGVPDLPYLLMLVDREFPGVTTVAIPMNQTSIDDFFAGRGEPVDALVATAERGSFYSLLHPAFSVAVPQPVILKIPLAYPVARHDLEFARFLGLWIDLKKKDGTIQSLYDHWILGKNAELPKKHWSVLRNVLHWVD